MKTKKTKNQLAAAKPTQRQKHISASDLRQIAFLVECRRMNYKEATAFLGINYQVWRNWLERAGNAPKWDYLVARVKSAYLEGRLKNIEDAERGRNGHRADWRASKALLEIADNRYLPQQPSLPAPTSPTLPANVNVWIEAAYLAFETEKRKPSKAAVVPPVKQIADAPAQPEPEPPATPAKCALLPAHWRERRRSKDIPAVKPPTTFEI